MSPMLNWLAWWLAHIGRRGVTPWDYDERFSHKVNRR